MNAVDEMVSRLRRSALVRLSRRRGTTDVDRRRDVAGRHRGDLSVFLNRLQRGELEALAADLALAADGTIGELRARLWQWGARCEAGGSSWLGTALQPEPRILRTKLVRYRFLPAVAHAAARWPRTVPEPISPPAVAGEPDTLEDLLDRASTLVGVRLGGRGRDKGAYGARVAQLLGVGEDGHSEPDWRGEVEIKTVPVARDRGAAWWVKEDPAVSMEDARPLAKLQRVLWMARVADEPDCPILSWLYQERGLDVDRLIERDLHTRPKGGAGASTRGWYLHKRFFIDNGLLFSLNQG